jgi:uncharacterized Zn finger protein
MYDGWGWKPYVPVAQRRAKASREMDKLKKKGNPVTPVVLEGRTIVKTFWGKAWCENLERYSDFANRLPRGRTYVRNGSVIDLQIAPGEIKALVSGSEIYNVTVKIVPVSKERWKSICGDCGGVIESLIELLQGRFSKGVMERICRQKTGLFPSPAEIKLSCSCPDWADMCKHVAAVLYGIGARLDQQPELLFRLHKVDEKELIVKAGEAIPLTTATAAAKKILGGEDLSALFGLDMAQSIDLDIVKPKPSRTRAVKRTAAASARSTRKQAAASRKSSGPAKKKK